ncbi:MAG: hypothetical protein AAF664_06660 [Planctomycetota bacterium]
MSAARAAVAVARGVTLVEPQLEDGIVNKVKQVNTRLITDELDVARFWQSYQSAIAGDAVIAEAVTSGLRSAGCVELQIDSMAAALSRLLREVHQVHHGMYPKLDGQLELRMRPLKDRWDTVGAGLMLSAAKQAWTIDAPEAWYPRRLTTHIVKPLVGGGGGVLDEAIWIEAMLTDVDPSVPEVVRLAYLVVLDAMERYLVATGRSISEEIRDAWRLAAVPMTLEASADLEVTPPTIDCIGTAMDLWLGGLVVEPSWLLDWWAGRDQAKPLPVVIGALHKYLHEQNVFTPRSSEDQGKEKE